MKPALTIVFSLLALLFSASSAGAQVKYEEVVEKIHYTHPNRTENGKPFDATKQTGSQNPLFKVYIWGDLAETYTQKFFKENFDQIKSTYGSDALFIYNHDPFLNRDISVQAAMIAECTAQQNGFWENILPIINNSSNEETLNALDYLQDINIELIKNCLVDPNTRSVIDTFKEDSKYFGFNSVPTVVIQNANKPTEYSIKISGAQDLEIYDKAFLEAKSGDLTRKEAQDLSGRVGTLEQETQQNQQDIQQTKEQVSALQQIVESLQRLVQTILDRLQMLFGGK